MSRPEIARIRGVASDSATATLLERGLIEEPGRSQFGAVLYRTTPLFLKLFGLRSLDDLPDPAPVGPDAGGGAPSCATASLRAGEARAGLAPATTEARPRRADRSPPGDRRRCAADWGSSP